MQAAATRIRESAALRQTLRIGILGTRGIPNHYGGFEQFAEKFGQMMAARGHEVYVYCSANHPYQEPEYEGVRLIHCIDPETWMGTAGQFLYDLACVRDTRKRDFDILLQLGYTSSSIWSWLMPEDAFIVTNMDGLEWKRSKYNRATQRFLRKAEQWAVQCSDALIADSPAISDYLQERYQRASVYIPYGATLYEPGPAAAVLIRPYTPAAYGYDLLVARFEPENNIRKVLQAYARHPDRQLVLVGNHQATPFGRTCFREFGSRKNLNFIGAIYEEATLNALRYYSRLYLHGHSVGGTNPSLLEAMACHALIAAHDNPFNRAVLRDTAFYFSESEDLEHIISETPDKSYYQPWLQQNRERILSDYNWNTIVEQLELQFRTWAGTLHI